MCKKRGRGMRTSLILMPLEKVCTVLVKSNQSRRKKPRKMIETNSCCHPRHRALDKRSRIFSSVRRTRLLRQLKKPIRLKWGKPEMLSLRSLELAHPCARLAVVALSITVLANSISASSATKLTSYNTCSKLIIRTSELSLWRIE